MAKTAGKTAKKSEAQTPVKNEQHYDYTSFIINDRKDSAAKEGYRSPISARNNEATGAKTWLLNVKVPETISPTGYMNVTLPDGKLSTDPEGKKNQWFKTPRKDKEGNAVEHSSMVYIANEVGELSCVATGRKDQDGVGTEIRISPQDLRAAVITQSKADMDAYHQRKAAEREVPDVGTQAEASAEQDLSR